MASRRCVTRSISITGCWRTKSYVPVRSTNGPSRDERLGDAPLQHELGLGGTRMPLAQTTIGVGASAWAMVISSTPGAGAIDAASSTCSGRPMQMATGSPSAELSPGRLGAPSLDQPGGDTRPVQPQQPVVATRSARCQDRR